MALHDKKPIELENGWRYMEVRPACPTGLVSDGPCQGLPDLPSPFHTRRMASPSSSASWRATTPRWGAVGGEPGRRGGGGGSGGGGPTATCAATLNCVLGAPVCLQAFTAEHYMMLCE
jgi:hypothetical protein